MMKGDLFYYDVNFYRIVLQTTDEGKLKSQQGASNLLGSSQSLQSSTGSLSIGSVIEGKNSQRSYGSVEPNGIRPRKPCNCTKSQCLKL